MNKFLKWLKNHFYNIKNTCNCCGRENFTNEYFCNDCLKKLPKITTCCKHCGRRTAKTVEFCDSCINGRSLFDKAYSVFCYKEPITKLISQFKFNNKKYLAEVFAHYLVEFINEKEIDCDIISFVPMAIEDEKIRGYNQSKLLAEIIAKKKNFNCLEVVQKIKRTKKQSKSTFEERLTNLKGSFRAQRKVVEGKNILIIDDVLTTGSTAITINKELKKKGANTVAFLTIASVDVYSKDKKPLHF